MRWLACGLASAFALTAVVSTSALAQRLPANAHPVPFSLGEHFEYDFKIRELGLEVTVGSGTMDVVSIDTVRSMPAWHTRFRVQGGVPLYRVNDLYESWMDVHTLASLRYIQDIHEGSYNPKRSYEIFPDRREYEENGQAPKPSVAHPLEDGSFIYFIRTIDLQAGLDTSFDNYFRPDKNPVRIRVVGREQIQLDVGTCNAIIIQPLINTTGLFSNNGQAQVWLSDDANHIMLQMKSNLPIKGGHLNLYLKKYRLGEDSTRRTPACTKRP